MLGASPVLRPASSSSPVPLSTLQKPRCGGDVACAGSHSHAAASRPWAQSPPSPSTAPSPVPASPRRERVLGQSPAAARDSFGVLTGLRGRRLPGLARRALGRTLAG